MAKPEGGGVATAPRWALYAAVVGFSLLVHLKGITAPLVDYHAHRQANTASIARNYRRHGLPPHRPRVDWLGGEPNRAATELPLYMWLLGLLWPVLGLGEIWGRLLSTAASAATAALLFRLLERRGNAGWLETGPAFLAGLAFSALPVEVYFGRTVQPEALALLSTVAAIWALDRFLASPGGSWGWWALAIGSAASAIGHKLPYFYLIGVLAVLALARRGPAAARDPKLWAIPALTLGLVFAWYRYASSGVYVVPTRDPNAFWRILEYRRLPYYMSFQVFSRLPELALTYPGLVLFAIGARELLRRRGTWFLGAWWACVLAGVLAGGAYSHDHEYTALPWAPVNAAFIGAGLWSLWTRSSWRHARLAALVLGLGIPAHAALRIRHWYHWSRPELLAAGPVVGSISAPDDLFLCNDRASSLPLFYIDRRGWSWDLVEPGPAGLREVEDVVSRGAKFLLAYREGAFLDREHPVAGWFFRRYPLVYSDSRLLIFRLDRARGR